MRILHVVPSVHKGGGGTSEVVPRLARALMEIGHTVSIATLHYEMSDEMQKAKAAGVDCEDSSMVSDSFLRIIGFSKDFSRKIEDLISSADIVHIHCLWMYPGWIAAFMALKMKKPYVIMPHGFLEPERLKISKWKKRIISWLIERKILANANAIIATAESEAAGIRKFGLNNYIHIMPIGIDLGNIDKGVYNSALLERLGADTTKRHLLFLSRITPIKGLDLLAEAWNRVSGKDDWQLLIVGPDDRGYTDQVRIMFGDSINTGSVILSGPVYNQDKIDLLKSVDAFILPTRSENWSIAVAEAMAAMLPVVCTKGAPWQCINEVGAGYWTEINAMAISNAITSIIQASDHEREIMGVNGRLWVERKLLWPKIAADMGELYRKVVDCGI